MAHEQSMNVTCENVSEAGNRVTLRDVGRTSYHYCPY